MSKISIVLKLIKLIKNLIPQMIMAILTGVAGFLCATFITVLGGYAILNIMNFDFALSIETLFLLMAIFAVLRGILRYGEQTFNHYIAFTMAETATISCMVTPVTIPFKEAKVTTPFTETKATTTFTGKKGMILMSLIKGMETIL